MNLRAKTDKYDTPVSYKDVRQAYQKRDCRMRYFGCETLHIRLHGMPFAVG
jgi:hypothetical protein